MLIKTEATSTKYRERMIDVSGRRLLVSRIAGSTQEQDLSEPANLDGVGRIRHFTRRRSSRWVPNPLPLDPACARLGLPSSDALTAQVVQNAACNWRCWYCYVPFDLLAAAPGRSKWVRIDELVRAYVSLEPRPPIFDLSGGQPELTPEWVPWTIEALRESNLSDAIYLWSDDNLSVDYYWQFLSRQQRELIREHRTYGRVGCFKGIDEESFAFNTGASQNGFVRQFELFRRYIDEGLDIYAYLTLVVPDGRELQDRIAKFMDQLQAVDPMLPLRTVPLEIATFSPVMPRLNDSRSSALTLQYEALEFWREETALRFSETERARAIHEVKWARP